ncbi:MAG: hypothetical protein IBJ03_04945 [Gemmatimonadaceae bacterium]|nr:hypothetical protein [Gemmatimonadaceae bacterium]
MSLAVLCTLSAMLYLWQSRAVAIWLEQADYLGFVIASYVKAPRVSTISLHVPRTWLSITSAIVTALASVASGWLVYRAAFVSIARQRAAAPLGLVVGLGVFVVPPLLLATVGWPDGAGLVTNENVAALHLVLLGVIWYVTRAGAFLVSRGVTDASRNRVTRERHVLLRTTEQLLKPWATAVLIVMAVLAGVVLLAGLSGLQGYDSFSDHIARPARWLVTGRLEPGAAGEVVTYYPGNFELLVRWILSFGSDRLSFLPSYASAIASVWVVYRLARDIGMPEQASRISAGISASLQVLAYQGMVVYSDTFTALCLLLATWLLVLWRDTGARDRLLTAGFGIALGLAMGAKYSAGPPVVILGLFWLWYAARDVLREGFEQPLVDVRWLAPQAAILIVSALPGMVFWYARNAIREGNPVFPLSVAGLPGIPLGQLLAGLPAPSGTWERLAYPWREAGHVLGFETGLGAAVAVIVVFAVLAGFWTTRSMRHGRFLWLVWLLTAAAWIQTGVIVPRYGLFPILLSFVFIGPLLLRVPSRVAIGVSASSAILTMCALSFQLAGGAAYNVLLQDPRPPIPSAIETLPPSTVLNLASQPSGYYAMGRDYRHHVITPFGPFYAKDLPTVKADYVLLPESRESEFSTAGLQLVQRWSRPNWPSTALWRLPKP